MSRIVNNLINRAYDFIGFENPSDSLTGTEVTRALNILNELLDDFSTSGLLIPYYDELTFNLTGGKESYKFSTEIDADVNSNRIIELDFINYTHSDMVYPIEIISRSEYFKFQRQKNYVSLPKYVYLQNNASESILTFYPIPDQDYETTIIAKFELDEVEQFTSLDTLPKYYDRFLKYALARELTIVYGAEETKWSPVAESQYQEMREHLLRANDIDMEIETSNALSPYYQYNRINRGSDV